MTLLEKLDTVLKCLEKHHSEKHHNLISIQEILDKEQPEVKWGETLFILKKLAKDGYIDTREISIPDSASTEIYYNINFEGRILNEENGYVAKNNSLQAISSLQKRQSILNEKLYRLTIWVAVGTVIAAIYYGIEIIKDFGNHCQH